MSMPDRIWAHVRNLYGLMTPENSTWNTCERGTEYVRADIVDAKDADLERNIALNHKLQDIIDAKDAEIDRLRARNEFLEKALDQAIELGQIKLSEQDAGSTPGFVLCDACIDDVPIEKAPELDAYLRERNNRPPNSGVQSGVQHPEEGGKSA